MYPVGLCLVLLKVRFTLPGPPIPNFFRSGPPLPPRPAPVDPADPPSVKSSTSPVSVFQKELSILVTQSPTVLAFSLPFNQGASFFCQSASASVISVIGVVIPVFKVLRPVFMKAPYSPVLSFVFFLPSAEVISMVFPSSPFSYCSLSFNCKVSDTASEGPKKRLFNLLKALETRFPMPPVFFLRPAPPPLVERPDSDFFSIISPSSPMSYSVLASSDPSSSETARAGAVKTLLIAESPEEMNPATPPFFSASSGSSVRPAFTSSPKSETDSLIPLNQSPIFPKMFFSLPSTINSPFSSTTATPSSSVL